jgi:hypothetical protein
VEVRELRADHPRGDGVDAHLRRPLDGEGLREREQTRLGGAVGGGSGRGTQTAHAGDVDDRAPVVLLLHDGVGLLGEVERRDEIQSDDRFGEAGRSRRRVRRRRTARVVDEHVEATEALAGEGHDPLDLVRLAHVGLHELGRLARHLRRLLGLVPAADQHPCARLQEAGRDAAPDAPRAAGHDHHASRHVEGALHASSPR